MELLKEINKLVKGSDSRGRDFIECKVGEIYRVSYLMVGGDRVREFTGICIGRKRKGVCSSVILRNVVAGIGIEYSFNIYSGRVVEIEKVLRETRKVRKAKLYFLRGKGIKRSRF